MKEDSIIKLENNEKYIILDKIFYDEEIYYFCSKTENKVKLVNDKIKFMVEKKIENEIYLAEIKDKELLKILINIVKTMA